MADLLGPVSNLSSSVDKVSTNLNEGIDIAKSTSSSIEEFLKLFGKDGWFKNAFDQLAESVAPVEGEDIVGASKKAADTLLGNDEDTFSGLSDLKNQMSDASNAVRANTSKATNESAASMFQNVNAGDFGTGMALIWWKLNEILDTIKNPKDGDSKASGKSVSGFFKGLLEGVGGIAALGAALIVFAGATVVFSLVDWPKALLGLVAFSAFMIGMVALAKSVGNEAKTFAQFGLASMTLSASLGIFSLSLMIASAVFSNKPLSSTIMGMKFDLPAIDPVAALTGAGLFAAFVAGVLVVSKLVSDNTGNMAKFGIGSMAMAGALGVFAISLSIMSAAMTGDLIKLPGLTLPAIDPAAAITGIGLFTAFELGVAVLSNIVAQQLPNFSKFALGSMAMAGALAVFSIALYVAANVVSGIDLNAMTGGKIPITLPGISVGAAVGTLAGFIGFVAAFIALANVANNFMSQILIFTGVSTLMSLSLVVFAGALMAAGVAAFGGEASIGGLKFSAPAANGAKALLAIPIMVAFLAAFGLLGVAMASPPVLAAVAIGGVTIAALSLVMIAMAQAIALSGVATGGEMTYNGKNYSIPAYNAEKSAAGFKAFKDITSSLVDIMGESPLLFAKAALAMPLFGLISSTIVKIAKSIKKVSKMNLDAKAEEGAVGGNWDKAFEPFIRIIAALVNVANDMDKNGRKGLAVITVAILPIAEAIEKVTGIITAFQKIDDKTINAAIAQMGKIMTGGGKVKRGFILVFNDIMAQVKATSKKSAETVKALPPVVESISKIVGVIQEVLKIDNIDEGISRLERTTDFISSLVTTMTKLTPGGMAGWFARIGGGDPVKELENANNLINNQVHPIIQTLKDVADKIADMPDADASIRKTNKLTDFVHSLVNTIGSLTPGGIAGWASGLFTGDVTQSMKDAANLVKGPVNDVLDALIPAAASLAKMPDKIDAKSVDGIVDAIKKFGKLDAAALENFRKAAEASKGTVSTSIDTTVIDSMSSLVDNLGKNLDKNDPFVRVANSVSKATEEIRNANNELQNMISKMSSIREVNAAMQKEITDAMRVSVTPATAPADTASERILEILTEWKDNGVLVYSNTTPASEEEGAAPQPSIFKI